MEDSCVVCNSKTDIKCCEICKEFSFCPECTVKERHTGSFQCIKCNRTACKTYEHIENVCWPCYISNQVKELNKASSKLQQSGLPLGNFEKIVDNTIDSVNEMVEDVNNAINHHNEPK